MDQNKLFLSIWGMVIALTATMVLALCALEANEQRLVAKAIAAGADPIKAHCAIAGVGQSNAAVCGAVSAW
jgi:hypothetical protein